MPMIPSNTARISAEQQFSLEFALTSLLSLSTLLSRNVSNITITFMTSLPSYLSSGASSRAHHAYLVKIHQAQSDQEEDNIIRQEVQRAKQELALKGGASLVRQLPDTKGTDL